MNRKIDWVNPFFIFSFIWLLVLALVSLQATKNLLPLNVKTLVLIFSSIFTFAIIFYVLEAKFPGRQSIKQTISPALMQGLGRFVRVLLCVWLVGTIFEIIVAKGIPLFWIFYKSKMYYTHFGIHTFHGLMNALYLFSITGLFLEYLVFKKAKLLLCIGMLLLWPVMMIERGILLGAIVQMTAIYFLYQDLNAKRVISLFLISLAVIIAFGFIGDLRFLGDYKAVVNPYASYITNDYKAIYNHVPSGFTWFYMYMTSPVNNIIANINDLHPSFVPYYSIFYTVPTALRGLIFSQADIIPIKLVDGNLNVSTFYVGFLADFGIKGTIIVVAFLQLFFTWIYLVAKQKQVWAMLAYAVVFECIVFSVFFNLLFLSVYLLQIFFAIGFKVYADKILAKQQLQDFHPTKNLRESVSS